MAMFRNVMVYLGLGPDDEYDENYLYDDENVDFEGLERRTSPTGRGSDGVRIFDDEDLGVGAVRPLRPVPDGFEDLSPGAFADPESGQRTDFSHEAKQPNTGMEHPSGGLGGADAASATAGSNVKPDLFETSSPGSQSHASSFEAQQKSGDVIPESSAARPGSFFAADPDPDGLASASRPGSAQSAQPRVNVQPQNDRSSFGMDEFSQQQSGSGGKPRTVVPRSFDDAKNVANEYRNGSPVVMNLREADKDTGRRLLDFSSGMVYGLGGGMEKLAANVFLISPEGVVVTADDRRRLEERGYGR